MHAFEVLGDPVRRRLVELLAQGDHTAGELTAVAQAEFGIGQPAVSNHLRVLRDSGFASATPQGARRLYAVNPERLAEVDEWVSRYHRFWETRLDALDTEVRRGRRRPTSKEDVHGSS